MTLLILLKRPKFIYSFNKIKVFQLLDYKFYEIVYTFKEKKYTSFLVEVFARKVTANDNYKFLYRNFIIIHKCHLYKL